MPSLQIQGTQVANLGGPVPEGTRAQANLLACGLAAAVLYAAMIVFVGLLWPEYSWTAQTVSELSAIGAPTRPLWGYLGAAYSVLAAAFGIGILLSAAARSPLRVAGWAMVAHGVLGIFYPPMHLRGSEFTLTDTMHIVFGAVTVLLMMVAIGFGGRALGARFRGFSIATLVILAAFGLLTAIDAPDLAANRPTPWIGLWERVSIAAFLVWMATLSVTLLRAGRSRSVIAPV
jgi:hypothetical protein